MLREVREDDLDTLFEQQREPEAVEMARLPGARARGVRRSLAEDPRRRTLVVRAIEVDGEVAGNIGSWEQDGRQLVGYWLGREFWGRGLATAALAEFVEELSTRPLHAWVAASNVGSIRVLEKCGFVRVGEHTQYAKDSTWTSRSICTSFATPLPRAARGRTTA